MGCEFELQRTSDDHGERDHWWVTCDRQPMDPEEIVSTLCEQHDEIERLSRECERGSDVILNQRTEIERLQAVVDATIDYTLHQLSGCLAGVPPVTEAARTERRMELRRWLHRTVSRYLEQAGGEGE